MKVAATCLIKDFVMPINWCHFCRANTSNNPAKALELVRAALQPSLNADIERVLLSYQEVSYSHTLYMNFAEEIQCTFSMLLQHERDSNMNFENR